MEKNYHSSDSDEEGKVRHDRFKSERHQGGNEEHTGRQEKYKSHHSSRHTSHRDRSSLTKDRKREITSSSSLKSRHFQEYDDKEKPREKHQSGKDEKLCDRKTYQNNIVNSYSKENVISIKPKLSSILENFDKKMESKHACFEKDKEIGPVLPPEMKKQLDSDSLSTECNKMDEVADSPALPPHLRDHEDIDINDDSKELLVNKDVKSLASNESVKIDENLELHRTNIEGPALPPHLLCKNSQKESTKKLDSGSVVDCGPPNISETKEDSQTEDSFGPILPPKLGSDSYGPSLPPSSEVESYGPALPPNISKNAIQGPSLPSGMTTEKLEALNQESSEDEDMVGPLPAGKINMTQYQLELRADHIKRKLEEEKGGSGPEIKKREEWMLELPPEKARNLGLGPRSFRMREAPDMSDRSSWTDTPADKLRKQEQAAMGQMQSESSEEMGRSAFIQERDAVMGQMLQQTHRDEDKPVSLLEMHQKKIKKKKKKDEKEGKKKERRPFDRNIDLQVNRFDEAQKKAIFKKAQLLDTRFSSGESKFL